MASPLLKKPKLGASGDREEEEEEEEEMGLVALVEHRAKEVELLKQKFTHYKSMLEEAEKKLTDSKAKLAHHRSKSKNQKLHNDSNSKSNPSPKTISNSKSVSNSKSNSNLKSRPQTPSITPTKLKFDSNADKNHSSSSSSVHSDLSEKKTPKQEKTIKRKIEEKEHQDLIPSLKSCSKPTILRFQSCNLIPSQHKRKMRCLELCPTNDNLFVTSALDGIIKFWQLQPKIPSASLLSSTDCLSPKERRWPEDLAFHPNGASIISVYSGDPGDSQISILDLNQSGQKRISFLEQKQHTKGLINNVNFMPWVNDTSFVTAGSDHSVILWKEEDQNEKVPYKHKVLHRNFHSSAVMGVCGLNHKKVVISVGADKWIYGFDAQYGRSDFKHQIEYKCMSVVTNPCDFNLYLVQSGAPGKQLSLYDVRLRRTEIHWFGWKQESSDSQSALINQTWSPDGWRILSGSVDPKFHIFDIRCGGHGPSQSVQAHQKRVFKAVWHNSIPVVSSISSDLNIGLHRVF
ncbi:hypothetical protein LUZ60_013812 [Juncus effusus]|nr:hypothetical protein LUZ60_013812 [Juncus effusus]